MQMMQRNVVGQRPVAGSRRSLVVANVAEVTRPAVSTNGKHRVSIATWAAWHADPVLTLQHSHGFRRLVCRRELPSSPLRYVYLGCSRSAATQNTSSILGRCVACSQDLPSRPRRNRRSESFRASVREVNVSPANFILPIFIHEESNQNVPIASMPGINRLAYGKNVIDYVAEARSYGVNQVVVFPKVRAEAWGWVLRSGWVSLRGRGTEQQLPRHNWHATLGHALGHCFPHGPPCQPCLATTHMMPF